MTAQHFYPKNVQPVRSALTWEACRCGYPQCPDRPKEEPEEATGRTSVRPGWRGAGRLFRYVLWTLRKDLSAEDEYEVRCVSGAERECGAYPGGSAPEPGVMETWIEEHFRRTGHARFRRVHADYAEFTVPGDAARAGARGVTA